MAICKHRIIDRCRKDGRPCFYRKECFEPEEPKRKTNADRIRAMSDEELAETFISAARGLLNGLGMNGNIIEDYKEAVLAMLKQPVEVENDTD